ncbi:hypothetical protein CC77DRAFT_1027643 [Alternaria alternata]|uniref:HypA-like protein n=1 Tax=Alternaria alternata TaxID=5599 RepID=A0A177E1M4_ALTAL|nr:hypothetical protein CC77DRAFT_1027643 [Alternaria alternata]OAG24889.1 hypothetical protein CC77DRAFT_1027643 [Alternaria alternata]
MATSSNVYLSPSQPLVFHVPDISFETATATSKLLQKNHENHHIFFNQSGFHNHIAHHLLTFFALNGTPTELERAWVDNASYQRQLVPLDSHVVSQLHDQNVYEAYLGREEEVLREFILKGNKRADDMLVRMFDGILHPLIHLGFGVEFEQPAIIAEALALAAVHDDWDAARLIESETIAKANDLDRRPDATIHSTSFCSRVYVTERNLEEKTAEMINAVVYFTSAAQSPKHQVKFDFFNIHAVNLSIFFSAFLQQSWLPVSSKIRLLEWKIRMDLTIYASPRPPRLQFDEITGYQHKQDTSWNTIFERVRRIRDDGHASKFVRALANGEHVCRKYEHKPGFIVKGDMWKAIANMFIESIDGSPDYIRGGGWSRVPVRKHSGL